MGITDIQAYALAIIIRVLVDIFIAVRFPGLQTTEDVTKRVDEYREAARYIIKRASY